LSPASIKYKTDESRRRAAFCLLFDDVDGKEAKENCEDTKSRERIRERVCGSISVGGEETRKET
jgi:hypothetical protein